MTFVDTGAWFALYTPTDPNHAAAKAWLYANRRPLIATDYVIDETLTLLRARRNAAKALTFGTDCFGGHLADIHYLLQSELAAAWLVFQRFADKEWSFTDCTSKVLIESLAIPHAFTFDHHFRQFGTTVVVP